MNGRNADRSEEVAMVDRDAFLKNRRVKNLTLLAVLCGLATLFYAITILKMA